MALNEKRKKKRLHVEVKLKSNKLISRVTIKWPATIVNANCSFLQPRSNIKNAFEILLDLRNYYYEDELSIFFYARITMWSSCSAPTSFKFFFLTPFPPCCWKSKNNAEGLRSIALWKLKKCTKLGKIRQTMHLRGWCEFSPNHCKSFFFLTKWFI